VTSRRPWRARARARAVGGLLTAACAAAFLAGPALASGGAYAFDGGTAAEQQQVRDALAASSFNWGIVPGTVTIHIGTYAADEAVPGEIFLDARLLDSGPFAWGVVQHEYAHQVGFRLLDDAARARVTDALGASTWCYTDGPALGHDRYGCERFASTLAWAYWQSPANCMKPAALGAESNGMTPAAFRALLVTLLGPGAQPTTAPRYATRRTAGVRR
jgi:hypothetical protein